jgi:NTE family protein
VLFEPVLREGKLLIDGSAGDCFPVEAIRQSCDVLIGSYTNSIAATSRKLGMAEIFDRGYHMSLYSEVAIKKNQCELFLEPPRLSDYSMFDFKKAEEIYQIGYDYALSYSEVLKSF